MPRLKGTRKVDPYQCPECGSKNITHRKRDNMIRCRRCGNEWRKPWKRNRKEGKK